MKRVTFLMQMDCRDDVPPHILEWMGDNLAEHAVHEFGDQDYDGEAFGFPEYLETPLCDGGAVSVALVEVGTRQEVAS